MKKLIFTLTTIFALSSFGESCPEGDPNCGINASTTTETGVIATGISCVGCKSFEEAARARLSNNKGVGITRTSQPKTSIPGAGSVGKEQ